MFDPSESLEQPSYVSRSCSVHSDVPYVPRNPFSLDEYSKQDFHLYHHVSDFNNDEGFNLSNILKIDSSKANSCFSLVKQYLINYRLLRKHMRAYFIDPVPRTFTLRFYLEAKNITVHDDQAAVHSKEQNKCSRILTLVIKMMQNV
ncbi:hypothetical protein SPOG_01856 [Schizosaccharomyces cryophilus OY26]|uniref:Uncharacterized protein n=1 Tax=Schizosaccharomyces cryophilus (strain OY26 / ATCC MYA-4695 / CBS 11777 / NBRC 106824 / NRRL Y48691) TaxID=653667 RepID=S9W2C0_SCHCR|nr:uncharacterized protein SPOG_01856 [Schizosaccharomyces cryophilus OY26]EPY52534.1 hypothetical protein SPOG_01856 [Schizosaccharomyces cryophilus OY26]